MIDLVLAATQRCGSTMILEDMRNAHVFGVPEEYFIPWYKSEKIVHIERELNSIVRKSKGENGFSSVKIMADQLQCIERKLIESSTIGATQFLPNVAQLFKDSKWIYIKRNDTLRQAISRHMSTETKVNHATQNKDDNHFAGNLLQGYSSSYNRDARYDFQKIKRHCQNIVLENIIWSNFFSNNSICPLVLSYEDLCAQDNCDYLNLISRHVGIDFAVEKDSLPRRRMVKLSNKKNDKAVAFFSLEMSAEQLANRILAEQASLSSDQIRRGKLTKEDFSSLSKISKEISTNKLFIDDTPAINVSTLRTRARRLKRKLDNGLGLIVVDYLQLMRGSKRYENRVQEISEITQGLKSVAKELDVPILALSQLSRAVEQREDKRPHLSDLRESGTIEQDADVVMFIYRQEYYEERAEPKSSGTESSVSFHEKYLKWQQNLKNCKNLADVIVAKQRHGPIGTLQLQFEAKFTKFSNLADDKHHPENI